MPGFIHTLIGVGSLCDADCTVTFLRESLIVRDQEGTPVITGLRKASGLRLWRIALQPEEANLSIMPHNGTLATLASYSACELPSVASLIQYFHAASEYSFRSTWLKAICTGNYYLWPGITLANDTKYCPSATATIMVNLVQK